MYPIFPGYLKNMKGVRPEIMKRSTMKKNKSKILICMILAGLIVGLSGCGTEREETEITMIHGWGSTEADHEAMRQIYKDFEKEHPEIHLNLVSMPSSTDVISKVSDLLTVGQIPDIVFTGGDGRGSVYQFMVEKGYAIDLIPYMEEDEEFFHNVTPSILSYWKNSQGELYTVSDVLLMGGYWYNRELFEKAGIDGTPKTWEEWEIACEKLEKLGQTTNPFMKPLILDTDHIVYLTNAVLYEKNSSELANIRNDIISIKSPTFQRTLDQLKKIAVHSEIVNTYSYRDALDSFNKGETAIYINGVWANSMINSNLDVAYATFPSEDGQGISMISSCVGYILGNTGDEKRMNASVEFIKYMLSEPVAKRILEETGQIPSNPNVEITKENANDRLYQGVTCVKEAGTVVETPANIWSLGLKDAYGECVIQYLKDRMTLDDMQNRLSEF